MFAEIKAFAQFIGSVKAVASAVWTAVQVYVVATGVKGYLELKDMMSKGQQILGQKSAQGGKIPVIYGRRRVGSTLALLHTHDGRSQNLVAVYALSVGEVDQIELDTIELNGVSIKDRKVFKQGYYAGSDKISSGAGSLCTASQIGVVQESNAGTSGTNPARRYRMVFNAHHGASDQTADPMLIASTPEVWSSNHRLRGIAYIAASFEYDTEGMFRGIPQLTVVVRGKKLYDPRKDGSITGGSGSHRYDTPSTFEWSDNAALCLLDYLRNDEYGKGLASSAINLQSFQTAANISDELEDTPDYSGSAAAATFSGTSGNNFFNVDETTWGQSKIGGLITLEDSGSSTEFDQATIIDALRYHEFEETNPVYQLVVDDTLSASYTNEVGTALVKVRRFHCNGVIDTNQNVLENTKELLANMRGILNYIDGKYEVTLEDTASSSFTVTDDHIIEDQGISISYENKSEKANKVVVQFFNALKKYEMDTVTVFHDPNSDGNFSDYKSDDGGEELELVVDFPYIVNKYVAYNMGEAILGRSRSQMTISFAATPELYKVKVGDVITVTYTPAGLSSKLFRVQAMNLHPDGLIDIQAVEYLDIYTWQAAPAENIEDIARVPTGLEVKAPSGLSFTDTDASSTGRSFLSWSEMTDYPNYEFRVAIVDSSSNKLMNRIVSDNFVDTTFLPVGSNYVASVTTINGQGAESTATTLTFTVGDEPVLSADIKSEAIVTSKLIDDAVTNAKIAVNAVQGDVIAAGAITTTKIGADAVTEAKIANDAVTADIIAANAVTSTQISDNAVTSPKILAGAVVAGKIATGAVTSDKVLANAIVAGKIASGAITTDKLNANAVTAAKIAANTITASQIASGTITASEIAANTITGSNINVDTLNVKFFADTTSKIINHEDNAVPLTRFASNYTTTANTGSSGTHTCVPVDVTQCRSGGSFVAYVQGILGDVENVVVEYSVDGGSSYSNASNGQVFTIQAGTYRGYTLLYNDTLNFTGTNETAKFRVKFVGNQNYTQIGLTVVVDNTN